MVSLLSTLARRDNDTNTHSGIDNKSVTEIWGPDVVRTGS